MNSSFDQTQTFAASLDNAAETWDVLAGYLETFIDKWEQRQAPPLIDEHLPADPPVLRLLTLIELIKVDLEYRWQQQDLAKPIEQYAEEFPELVDELGLPADLIYEEYHVRKGAGETVSAEEYFQRFPQQERQLRRLLGLEECGGTTSMFTKAPVHELEVGQQIDDFLLLQRLGKGAFGSVYLARQQSMQRMVALKVSADKGIEAQTLAQLEHNHIVRVYDQRIEPERRLRLLYMQYVPGGTLQEVIESARPVPLRERTGRLLLKAVDEILIGRGESAPTDSLNRQELQRMTWPQTVCKIGAQLADALHYAHSRKVLHRDVKPANVLVAADATPKLADFNISFSSQLDGASPAAYFGGSLAYMSPEQLEACNPMHDRQADSLDGRSDVYAVGVLLWELLYGDRPYPGEEIEGAWSATLAKMAERRRTTPPEPPRVAGHDECLARLQEVLSKALRPEPEDRYADAGKLSHDLWLCLQPRAQRILRAPDRGWRAWAKRAPTFTFMLVIFVPHVLAAIFNYTYNHQVIIKPLAEIDPRAVARFEVTQMAINSIAFPLALVIFVVMIWPVAKAMKKIRQGGKFDPEEIEWIRRHSLRFGYIIAIIGTAEWLIAGIAYPLCLQLSPLDNLHFSMSLAICGLIAAAYPYFGAAFIVVRVLYPALLAASPSSVDDEAALGRLARHAGVLLVVAGGVPSLAVFLLFLHGLQDEFIVRVALGVLSVAGVFGVFLVYAMYRIIQFDVAALITAAKPSERVGSVTDSVSGVF